MILADNQILENIENGNIKIIPFVHNCLGSNSYDVHLGRILGTYIENELDCKKDTPLQYFEIPDEGFLLQPNMLYLGVTQEYTETKEHVPFLEGKSSLGRLGVNIHITAGKGDVGFKGNWTLEICCVQPVRIYAEMPIGQLIYFELSSIPMVTYDSKSSSKYNNAIDFPIGSKMNFNF